MFWSFGKSKSDQSSYGFTILELLVVISIFLVITGVVIADIPSFRNKSSLDLITSEVATYVRGAQVYGATQRGSGNGDDNVSYGVNFNLNNGSTFFLFKNSSEGAHEETYDIQGFKVTKITVYQTSGQTPVNNELDIIFRANDYTSSIGTQLEPEIKMDGDLQSGFDQVDIEIRPDRDQSLCKLVRVYGNGQIAPVALDTCDPLS
ncbi:MAG: hypothetical protein COV08_00220 [Candidatus Vogelbacteria bacterium CG10_big_fil_rev_8_21_14_0_10_49_38]|uniref:Prepilin-type N-terminal cleavage/methylation domain-containing protein n=1 Tax=Candidatus Vogelbacteria bacterium CG10_big_fil_rev_8_21_14_0_10_49_38 TaxID=1975043 RepID=A0A2H0RIR1_9BACT|nr:MAG: hypothetical protein BK006_00220 [bacterium CG10_49_38]PIR46347.1 MAG: hypothetical protein COV08_00220 [Candidatus Vogelbacteria bacterium CG10_big_fil_rev_8_21_14_0_10_49_38]